VENVPDMIHVRMIDQKNMDAAGAAQPRIAGTGNRPPGRNEHAHARGIFK